MYVTYDDFASVTVSDMGPEDYGRFSAVADAVIDDWTLNRVGRAVSKGEALPRPVVVVYCAIVEALPEAMAESKGGARLSAFSNGVDSFTFAEESVSKRLADSVGWMFDLLPVEWRSAAVCFEGGNAYAG